MVRANFEPGLIAVRHRGSFVLAAILLFCVCGRVAAQNVSLTLDPQKTTVNFTLGDVLHTVRGTFQLKQGSLILDSSAGKLSGEILVDARSGQSGNGMRDRKMHREVLESDRFPEIIFRPDRVEHEVMVPAQVEMFPDRWTVTLHFTIPYAKWGMKNPSTLFLRVSESVEIDVAAGGPLTRQ
jgi:hypothetical protein